MDSMEAYQQNRVLPSTERVMHPGAYPAGNRGIIDETYAFDNLAEQPDDFSTVDESQSQTQDPAPTAASHWANRKTMHFSKHKWPLIILIVIIVSSVLFIGLVLGISQDTATNKSTIMDQKEILISKLQHLSSDAIVLEDNGSPQGRALNWLATDDLAMVHIENQLRLESRYALATLYFATNAGKGSWDDDLRFLSEEHECTWTSSDNSTLRGVGCNPEGVVTSLRLDSNGLRGTIPEELQALSALEMLNLANNTSGGGFPWQALTNLTSIWSLSSLTYLDLASNLLRITMSSEIGHLTSLRILSLRDNKISGTFPWSWIESKVLEEVDLAENSISGSLSSDLGSITSLQILNISNNKLDGRIPDSIGKLTKLETLDLSQNRITGSLPDSIGNLTSIRHLDLSVNAMGGELPRTIGNLISLETLKLATNKLSGTIPTDSIGNLTSIRHLDLSANAIGGELPRTIANLISLETLKLATNELSGTIPTQAQGLGALLQLDLSDNRLAGALSGLGVGSLPSTLVSLDLSGNQLTGPIPVAFGRMVQIEHLSLGNNDIVGGIEALINMTSLVALDLRNSEFACEFPAAFSQLSSLRTLNLGFTRFVGADVGFLCHDDAIRIHLCSPSAIDFEANEYNEGCLCCATFVPGFASPYGILCN